jgi:hypothetical protein
MIKFLLLILTNQNALTDSNTSFLRSLSSFACGGEDRSKECSIWKLSPLNYCENKKVIEHCPKSCCKGKGNSGENGSSCNSGENCRSGVCKNGLCNGNKNVGEWCYSDHKCKSLNCSTRYKQCNY